MNNERMSLSFLAANFRKMGKADEAIRYHRLALELDPSIDFACDNLERLTGRPNI
jgi:ribosomal protein S12 methylthiotransferase accessory factor